MRRHQPVRSQFFSTSIRAAIKFSDWARRSAFLILLTGVVLASAAVWLTSNTSAHMWVWKGWERMFGSPSVAKVRPRVFAQLGGGGNYTITAIDEPSAGTSAVEGTLVSAVNASGAVTGTYSDQANVGHGFVYANGAYASFDAPGAGMNPTSGWNQGTVGIGIDTAGDVVGMFADSNNAIHGFLREAASPNTITVLDDPNAPKTTSSRGTIAMGINDAGQVIGYYMTGTYDTTSTYQGFIYSIASETFTTIAEPKAGTGNTSYRQKEGTVPIAINASGAVTGYYSDSNAINHGFVYSAGTYASFDVTGATTNTGHGGNLTGTIPDGIDAAGDVVGSYTDSAGVRHGFIRSAASGNPITTFDAPEANTTSQSGTIGGTFPTRIDPTGSYISGIVEDTAGLSHGFVYYLPLTAVASFTVFNAPNAATSLTSFPFTGTGGFGVNASGTVAGIYLDSSEVMHGFKYTPTATQTPTFSPAQGTFNSEQSVSISDADSSAIIYYTTDGSTPTVNSSEYTDPVSVSSTETIKAIALDTSIGGNIESAVASATYTINLALPTATPTISPVAGTYTSTQTVTILDATSGATIYYTTNGTTPTTSSIIYSAPISVAESETIKAIATANGYSASVVASAAYVITNSGGSTNEWAWIGGSSTVACNSVGCSQPGLYGALGTPAQGNVPGGRQGGATWTDISGNLWLFGGTGFDAGSNGGFLNDLWRFSPSANLWTWMGGSKTVGSSGGQPGVYGTMGVAATGNMPGARSEATSWTDSNGNLWLFGGTGFDSGGGTNDADRSLFLNDLWKFNPSTLEWTWMGGSSSAVCPSSSTSYCGQPGVYGTKGSSGAGNIPGGRNSATASTDSNGNFWLFGGYGYAAAGACCYLNDLWEFNPSTDVWTWVSGGSGGEQAGLYGTEGTPAPGNAPGSRYYASSWFDQNGDFWLYGGYGFDASSTSGYLDDLWEFNPSTKNWVWLAGSDASTCWSTEACPSTAIYGTLGVPAAADTPGNRSGASSWTDKSGNFWLFGSNAWRLSGTTVTNNNLNDLWELNLSPQEWGWMSGSSVSNKTGTYGTLGMPAAGNSPGGREFASSWTDGSGNLWLFGGAGIDASGTSGWLNDLWEYQLSVASLPSAATPTFSPTAGTYNSAQSITISDATAGSTIFYTTNGTTPTTSSSVYSGPITVSSSETIEAIAVTAGYSNSAVASVTYTINIPQAATPTFSPSAGTYTSAQTVTITDSTPGATIYYSTNGTTPTAGSSVYSGPIAVSSTETIEAMATASGYSDSAAASATYTINIPTNPVPVIAGLSPALTTAGSTAFTLTVTGSGFIATSLVNWGSAALATQYVNATQLTAQVPASDIGNTGTTSITVQTPAPGGGTSNSLFFEVDSAGTTPPTFTTFTDTVTPGSTASYPVTLPSGATDVSVTCLNLPSGASCSYSSTSGAVTIATSSTTPAGTYQITVVFNETLPGAATGFVLLPFLMLPLLFMRRRLSLRGIWFTACVWLAMVVGVACTSGCGGGGGGGSSSESTPQTHQVSSSGVVSLTIQ